MPNLITLTALVFFLFSLIFLLLALRALRQRRWMRFSGRIALVMCVFAFAAFFGALSIGIRGYQALTHEEVAAIVKTEPIAPQRFRARFQFPDGRQQEYSISGDELYVDARVLKWRPVANILGLHTAYELDRVGGRYRLLPDEQQAPRTIYGLHENRLIDAFDLRQRYSVLAPLLDAEYGSASFVSADQPQTLEVRVSTTGLLIRRVSQ